MALVPSLFLILSALLLSSTTFAQQQQNNVMFTGDTIPNQGRLVYGSSNFIMQNDCNLVLYGGQRGFQSNTANNGEGCTLRLDDRGIFRIQDNNGREIWHSIPDNTQTQRGEYVAMVRPDGEVAVYGPQRYSSREERLTTISQTAALPNNVLFSGDIINRRNGLNAGDVNLQMTDDCRLVLQRGNEIIWTPPSFNQGNHCFAHLDHRGRLHISDDELHVLITLPTSNERFEEGEYVLVLRSDGVFGVYGPQVWATPRGGFNASRKSLKINMVTAK